jgi:hypothetical protein
LLSGVIVVSMTVETVLVALLFAGAFAYAALLVLGMLRQSLFGADKGRGRMLCPICSKGLKGTRMVTVAGTVYHQKCYQRRGRRV